MNDHRIEIREDVHSRNPAYANVLRRKPGITLAIALWSTAPIMGLPIDLDSEMMAHTEEIEDVAARRMLAAKLQACRALAKFLP
ncbi:hypothetical protein ASG67_01165 [Sphingomonas sp. Leaf339]|nr:hypothetical protein ASG67_01165 [Sphingomonas sp. Leaf339]